MLIEKDKIEPKTIKLIDCQIELILKSLELYALNMHNVWGIAIDEEELERRNAVLFYTYNSILPKKENYNITYDFIRVNKLEREYKKQREFAARKNRAIS